MTDAQTLAVYDAKIEDYLRFMVMADDAFYDKSHNIPNLHFTTVSEYK